MTRYFTLQQAAREVQTHTMVIYRAIRAGALHAVPTPERDDWLIEKHCLAAWLDRFPCEHRAA